MIHPLPLQACQNPGMRRDLARARSPGNEDDLDSGVSSISSASLDGWTTILDIYAAVAAINSPFFALLKSANADEVRTAKATTVARRASWDLMK